MGWGRWLGVPGGDQGVSGTTRLLENLSEWHAGSRMGARQEGTGGRKR